MALVLKDRVRETSTTTGTIPFTLAGAVTGFQSFSAIGDGNTTYYTAVMGTEWEVGIGVYQLPNLLSRSIILASSNSNLTVNFSSGTKDVFCTFPAEGFAIPPAIGGTTPAAITGTTIVATTAINLPAVVNTGATTGRLYMVDGGDGYDYISIDTWDGLASYPVYFPGGINVTGTVGGPATSFTGTNALFVGDQSTYPGYISLRGISADITIQAAFPISVGYTLTLPTTAGSNNQVLKTDGSGNLSWSTQGVQGTAPVTVTAATYTATATDQWIIGNRAGTITITLPTASTNTGRSLNIKTIQAQTVVSASSNVVPINGGAAGTAILAATIGKYATLVSDGTNWIIMQAN